MTSPADPAAEPSPPPTRRRRVAIVAAVLAVLVVAATGIVALIGGSESTPVVAVVNNDTGVTVPGAAGAPATTVRAGADLVTQLTESDAFRWVDGDGGGDVVATVTIPADFSTALASAEGASPVQAQVRVDYGSSRTDRDEATLTAVLDAASTRTSSTGIKGLLQRTARARVLLQQAQLPAQILATATGSATQQGQQLLGSVDQFLPFLQTASEGADQLVAAAGSVSRLVEGARMPTGQLADRLNQLNLTIGDVTRGAAQLGGVLEQVQNLLTSNGLDARPVAQTRSDLELASSQLSSFTTLLGSGPNTELGDAVQNGFNQLASVSDQLSTAGSTLQSAIGPIAAQAPALLSGSRDQILGAIDQLKNVSAALNQQLTAGVAAIPNPQGRTQDALATVLSEPITVDYAGPPRSDGFVSTLTSARTVALVFGVIIVILAVMLAMQARSRRAH